MSCSARALSWSGFIQGLTRTRQVDHPIKFPRRVRPAPYVLQTVAQGFVSPASLQWCGFHESRDSSQQTAHATLTTTEKTRVVTPFRLEEDNCRVSKETWNTLPGSQSSPVTEDPEDNSPGAVSANNAASIVEGVSRRNITKTSKSDENKSGPFADEPKIFGKRRDRRPANVDGDKSAKTSASEGRSFRKSQAKAPTLKPDEGYGSKGGPEDSKKLTMEPWKIQKRALKEKFPDGWNPRKRLSPDALAGIRALNAQFPDTFTTEVLAQKFKVTPEAIRRILRSTWEPTPEQEIKRQDRWFRRGQSVWERKAALGIKPPRKWRREGIVRSPEHHERRRQFSLREKEIEKEEIRRYQEHRARMQKGLPPPRQW